VSVIAAVPPEIDVSCRNMPLRIDLLYQGLSFISITQNRNSAFFTNTTKPIHDILYGKDEKILVSPTILLYNT